MSEDPEERLRDIYNGLCGAIEAKVKNPSEVTAADIQAIRGFLKDNGITSIRRPGNKLDSMVNAVEEFEGFPFAVDGTLLPADDPAVKASGNQ